MSRPYRLRHLFRRPVEVSAEEAAILLDEGALLIDVRQAAEWERQHIPGAIHVPLADLPTRAMDLPQDRVLITFCTGGLRSAGAANLLSELGFDARNMVRGLIDWKRVEGALVRGAQGDAQDFTLD